MSAATRLTFHGSIGRLVRCFDRWLTDARFADWHRFGFTIVPKALDRDPIVISTTNETLRWRASRSGDQVAFADSTYVQICNTNSGDKEFKLGFPSKVVSFEWSPDDGLIAACCEDKALYILDAKTGKIALQFKQPELPISTWYTTWSGSSVLNWSADGSYLDVPGSNDFFMRIDVPSGHWQMRPMKWPSNAVGVLSASPNHERIHVWEGENSSHILSQLDEDEIESIGSGFGWKSNWHKDSRRLIGADDQGVIRASDTIANRRLGTLFPEMTDGHWLCIGPTGHCRGSKGVTDHVVYVAQLDDGSNITLAPQEFAKRFSWKNDAEKATLMSFDE